MIRKYDDDEYRGAWLESHVKALIAAQFRAIRGERKQGDFGRKIGASQSVVARYENPSYGSMTINTLLEIAKRLKIGLQVRFVPFSAVMDEAKNLTSDDLAPLPYAADMKIRDSRSTDDASQENRLRIEPPRPKFALAEPQFVPTQDRQIAAPFPLGRPAEAPINKPKEVRHV